MVICLGGRFVRLLDTCLVQQERLSLGCVRGLVALAPFRVVGKHKRQLAGIGT